MCVEGGGGRCAGGNVCVCVCVRACVRACVCGGGGAGGYVHVSEGGKYIHVDTLNHSHYC